MEDKNSRNKSYPDKWWNNWWRSNFTDPLNWEAFNFQPFHLMLADKLGIDSYWGFAKYIIIITLVGIFLRFGLDFILTPSPVNLNNTSTVQADSDSPLSVWLNYPELHTMIIAFIAFCVVSFLIIWWFYNKDN